MKRIFTIIVLGAVISFAGCADLDDIYRELDDLKKRNKEQADRLNDHEARLKALEGLVRTANSEITTLKGLVNAVEKRVSVVSYKELADMSGYELIMSDGTTINLKHGKASVVGTKVHTDGLLYWTLNGEFMRDALGKMICAQGKEGVTPTLRVNTAGHWEVSFDGATTWQEVKDSNGYPVKAIGEDGAQGPSGTSHLSITETDTTIVVTFMGQTYSMPKWNGSSSVTGSNNPLSYVAEYNVNCSGDGFVTNLTDCNGSGYFSYDDAVSWFSNITIDGKRYHLPNKEEWRTIVPHGFYFMNAFSTWNDWSIDVRETVTLRGVSMTFTSDFCVGVDSVSYALRYKGTDWVSAWRYEYISDGNNTHMKITARSLQGQLYGISAYVIVRPDFWSANAENDVVRYFPASGLQKSGSRLNVGSEGYFWSSSQYDTNYAQFMCFLPDRVLNTDINPYSTAMSVRLFATGD
ncbi:MAG TPA: hypothetical protein GXZ56_03565 [Bacteroidales bacterium]|jgi:hypothetical protein|nr:hypothetical protein [Bacteroidales bacterium]